MQSAKQGSLPVLNSVAYLSDLYYFVFLSIHVCIRYQNRGQIFESPQFFGQDVNKYEKAPDTKKIIKTRSNCCPIPTSEEFGRRKTRRATYLEYKLDPSGIGYILELT